MKIFVAIPAYDCKLHVGTALSLAAEMTLATGVGFKMTPCVQPGMALVHSARNLLVQKFLESDHDVLVFVDADCGWQPGAILNLIMHRKEIVAGACRRRREPEDYAMTFLPDRTQRDGLIEVEAIGTAFMAISRSALTKFEMATPERAYVADGQKLHGYFDSPVRDGMLIGEDVSFCQAWRAIGGKIYVDPSITLQHLEGMTTYEGNLAKWLNL